ncbi:hypothetical protein [Paenibacillus periandrae]|uniref:hypothetical protein n=1 Tax=Paenibacillus periandrae TaxID=1761741 RepID=UPI001F09BE59|nr:hypothetical protein [Paenibacillus periandrae]
MAIIQPKLEIVVNPAAPVQEVCEVITALSAYHPSKEVEILTGLMQAIGGRLQELEKSSEQEEPTIPVV